MLVQPDTVLRWHRELFKHFWSGKSRHTGGKQALAADVVALIKHMASENWLCGAERIRGELLKLDSHVSKSTIQKYLPKDRTPRSSQTWRTFVHNHSDQIWACDFIQVFDLLFRSLFVFVIIEIGSRRVVPVGVTRHPTDAWVAQQIREATPFGQTPRFLLRDNDRKYGHHVWAVTQGAGIHVLKTPVAAPRANSFCERFVGSVRRECLDHILSLSEAHLRHAMNAYTATSMPNDRIKASVSKCPLSHHLFKSCLITLGSLLAPSWAVCITPIFGRPRDRSLTDDPIDQHNTCL